MSLSFVWLTLPLSQLTIDLLFPLHFPDFISRIIVASWSTVPKITFMKHYDTIQFSSIMYIMIVTDKAITNKDKEKVANSS
jgi:hypothetical protein